MEQTKEAIEGIILDAAISKAIEDNRELLKPSMQHFIGGGKVNGQFDLAIKKLMRWVENKTIEAVSEYERNVSIAFAEWVNRKYNFYFGNGTVLYGPKRMPGKDQKYEGLTTTQLFDLFIKEYLK